MAAGWTDQHGGLRACRARLRERYPVLTSSTLASALGFHPTWYSRVESGKAGLTVTNFARVAGGVLGLLAATYPNDVWTLHDLIRDVPRPDPLPQLPSLPTEPHTYTWHTEDLEKAPAVYQPSSSSTPTLAATSTARSCSTRSWPSLAIFPQP